MRYVIDIDGTICTDTQGNYADAEPLIGRIEQINRLSDKGHEIVYFTARGMGRHKGDAALAYNQLYATTYQQLLDWGCKFDKLIMGKPAGDIYIDDKAMHAWDFFGSYNA